MYLHTYIIICTCVYCHMQVYVCQLEAYAIKRLQYPRTHELLSLKHGGKLLRGTLGMNALAMNASLPKLSFLVLIRKTKIRKCNMSRIPTSTSSSIKHSDAWLPKLPTSTKQVGLKTEPLKPVSKRYVIQQLCTGMLLVQWKIRGLHFAFKVRSWQLGKFGIHAKGVLATVFEHEILQLSGIGATRTTCICFCSNMLITMRRHPNQ